MDIMTPITDMDQINLSGLPKITRILLYLQGEELETILILKT